MKKTLKVHKNFSLRHEGYPFRGAGRLALTLFVHETITSINPDPTTPNESITCSHGPLHDLGDGCYFTWIGCSNGIIRGAFICPNSYSFLSTR